MAKVRLRPLVNNINMPTVLKTATFPGEVNERLFIATQVGEIFYTGDRTIGTFLDIRPQVLKLGASGGYDERGLLGLSFHPGFQLNGLFYLHYSVAGSQGPGAMSGSFKPDPCQLSTLNLKWTNREIQYDHIDTVEEWEVDQNSQTQKRRTLLNMRRPFLNHNGVNSLNFSPETGKLVLSTGDGGAGYDPFNLSQDLMEIAGKIIEIDISNDIFIDNIPAVTRFDQLPETIQGMLTVVAKGIRNTTGISYQRLNNSQYIKYIGNVGQDLVESIFSFLLDRPIPVTQLVKSYAMRFEINQEGFINFGWRGWEGDLPTLIMKKCPDKNALDEKTIAYYDEVIETSAKRISPLTCYYHSDFRKEKFQGTALTGVQSYMGNGIPELTGSVVFTDLVNKASGSLAKGVLAYAKVSQSCKPKDYSVIEIDYDFGSLPAYYVSLGTNISQTKLFLGVYGSTQVAKFNQGTIFEVVP